MLGLTGTHYSPRPQLGIDATLSASPCGRWILVMDTAFPWQVVEGQLQNAFVQITFLEASTGRTLAQCLSHNFQEFGICWSISGDVCLLAELCLVMVYCPQADPTFKAFQHYELLGGAASQSHVHGQCLSLSPCGSIVVGLNLCAPGLHHWQIPPSSTSLEEAPPASKILQPLSLIEFSPGPQAAHDHHEAWYPLYHACIYAILSTTGSVHLIDAKANRCIQCWTQDELHCPATPMELAQVADTSSADGHDDETLDDALAPHVLSWSKDGHRLAIASGAYGTSPARCHVLHFSCSLT